MKVSVPTSEIEDQHERDSGWLRSLGAHNMRSDAWGNLGKELYTWAEQQPFSERTAWVAKVGKGVSCR